MFVTRFPFSRGGGPVNHQQQNFDPGSTRTMICSLFTVLLLPFLCAGLTSHAPSTGRGQDLLTGRFEVFAFIGRYLRPPVMAL